MSLFQELKRRNVFKATVGYVITAWLVMQIADVVLNNIEAPDWIFQVLMLFLGLGFPMLIVFAWAFELTPDGLKRESEVDRSQSIASETGRKLDYSIIAVLVLALGYFAYDKFFVAADREAALVDAATKAVVEQADAADEVEIDRSIAVLPFINMSDDINNEYFSDGISEELLNLLAKIPELKVASRSSAFQFKGEKIDIPVVAKQLNVAHVLEGSVRKSGNQIRVTAQLIKAEDGYHMWSESYDRTLDDVFVIQDEISAAVVSALKIALLGEAPKAEAISSEAYAHYLQGRYFYNQPDQEGWSKAVTAFQHALAIDPNYSPAWAILSKVYADQADYGYINAIEGMALARSAAQQAISLNPKSATAWSSLGYIHWGYDWNWAAAEAADVKALELEPGNVDVITQSARVKETLGFSEEAIALNQRAIALDPLSLRPIANLGLSFQSAKRRNEAEATYRQLLTLNPQYPNGHTPLALILAEKGQFDEALIELELETVEVWRIYGAALVNQTAGKLEAADNALEKFIEEYASVAAFQVAEIYAYRGENDVAFEWLERAYAQRDGGMTGLLYDQRLTNLHTDPRWEDILQRIGLHEYWLVKKARETNPAP